MSLLERDMVVNDLLDRVERLEFQIRELNEYAIVPPNAGTAPEQYDWSQISGWVVTGEVLRDVDGRIILDPSEPSITIAAGGYIQSNDFVSGSAGFQINGGTAEFNDVVIRGTVYADAGEIGGWTINSDNIAKNDATLHSDGYLVLGTGNDVVRVDAQDATYRLWVGNAAGASAPFSVSKAGAIYSVSGEIGGWTIGAASISKNDATLHSDGYLVLGTSNDVVRVDAQDGTYRLWVGHATGASAPFRVSKAGEAWMTNAHVTGEIDANSGHIGTLDVDGVLTVGTGSPMIQIDGPNKRIESSNFASGVSGFRITETGEAEFNKVTVRGELHSSVFVKDLVDARAGTSIIAKSAGVLDDDVAVPGSGTWTIDVKDPPGGGFLFENSDICRIKSEYSGGVAEIWFTVSGRTDNGDGSQRYTCTYQNGTRSITYPAGAPVIDYGVSGDGLLLMTAELSDAPYYDVATHAGAPWTTTTLKTRLGNLDGVTDADLNPSGFGLYCDDVYLKGRLIAGNGTLIFDDDGGEIQVAAYSDDRFLFTDGTNTLLRWYKSTSVVPTGLVAHIGPASVGDLTFLTEYTPGGLGFGGGNFIVGRQTGASTFVHDFVVKTTGKVGVGTSSPGQTLAVNGYVDLEYLDTVRAQFRVSDTVLDIDTMPDSSDDSYIRFFRLTNTTGSKVVQFFRGNATATIHAQIGVDGISSYFQVGGGNFGIGTSSQFGSGSLVIGLANAATNPSTNPSSGGVLYADGGALKWRGSSGTVTTIAPA